MKKTILSLMLIMGSFSAYGLDIQGDANSFTGNITSVTLTDEGGVINVVGSTGKYGKVWLTYNLKLDNSNHPTQGSFSGRATAINDQGERNAASRQGVWERKGNILNFYSLDDVTDGNFYLCITEMNLSTDALDMKFYSVK
jgi:hypothetical protein|tara:strand:- start:85 stop:507 length:423 start_codon:yes stop_codon:yes gene_type:complete